ncbi:hypothetical protein E4U54_004299 [Claviceps lovelessii]|nr:hypothetical protein E4U54_004299 [Claviceps lovelessii]
MDRGHRLQGNPETLHSVLVQNYMQFLRRDSRQLGHCANHKFTVPQFTARTHLTHDTKALPNFVLSTVKNTTNTVPGSPPKIAARAIIKLFPKDKPKPREKKR